MGVYKSDSWKKASVFNPLTGDVALMTTLIGGETFLAPQEEIVQETTNGNYISQWRHRVQFACSDWDAFDTLKGFKDGHIAVRAAASAESLNCANLQWYESVQIKELRKVPKPRRADGDSHFVVVLEYEGDENAAIFNNVNLLHQRNVNGVVVNGFVDTNADNLAEGWAIVGGAATSFVGGVQTITPTNPISDCYLVSGATAGTGLVFPIASDLTLSFETTKLHADTNKLFMISRSFAAGYLSDAAVTITEIGRKPLLKEGATQYFVEVRILNIQNVDGTDTAAGKEPCLRTDGSSEYIAG